MSRILIVDDEPAILRGLADNLKRELHEVLTAADGENAYELIKQKKPDLVVLDLMLPKLSGYEVCRQMRSEGIKIPILMLTARGEETDRVLGLDMGRTITSRNLSQSENSWRAYALFCAVRSPTSQISIG